MTETKVWGDRAERVCSLCGATFRGLGNNPEPLKPFEERCCDTCNYDKVIPARLGGMRLPRPEAPNDPDS